MQEINLLFLKIFQLLYFLCYFDMSTINPTVIFLLIEQAIKSLQSLFFRLLFI